jgi:succinyl-CoA synthetase beta subunit
MRRLTEDLAKSFLRRRGHPVPQGEAVDCASAAASVAQTMLRGAVVKALVPTGRRGLAGGVRVVDNPEACQAATAALLGASIDTFPVRRVLVEERVQIASEYYLSFALQGPRPEVLLSASGGIEIERTLQHHPEHLIRAAIDPLRGLAPWTATELWLQAGVRGKELRAIASLTAELFETFKAADALLLEINPLALTSDGSWSIVGAMLGVDECALFRHPEWTTTLYADDLPANPRERSVALASVTLPGGECSYVELEGDIGLLVGGGGAGLYQHDLVLELGGRPANHCVTPPTGADDRKLKAVIRAILEHPSLHALLVGFNFAQMARADIRVRALVEVLQEMGPGHAALPIVIRLFGAGEAEARAMVADRTNIHYVSRGTSLREAAALVVQLAADRAATVSA